MTSQDGGPAFPHKDVEMRAVAYQSDKAPFDRYHRGMTLRDFFAGQALTGMLANTQTVALYEGLDWPIELAAYQHADKMLAARAKREGGGDE